MKLYGLFYKSPTGDAQLCDLLDGVYEACAYTTFEGAEAEASHLSSRFGVEYLAGEIPEGIRVRFYTDDV